MTVPIDLVASGLNLVATIVAAAKKAPDVVAANARRKAVDTLAAIRGDIATMPKTGHKAKRLHLAGQEAGWVAWLRSVGLDDYGRPLLAPPVPMGRAAVVDAVLALVSAAYADGYHDGSSTNPANPLDADTVKAVRAALAEVNHAATSA